jgi:hypothetical protein
MADKTEKLFIILSIIISIAIICILISSYSCGCGNDGNDGNDNSNDNYENYSQEYTGQSKSCTNSYRLYMNSSEQNDTTIPRDRCKLCKGYNNYSYESYQPPCPHNCRQYGISLCDQGTIM